MTSTTGYDVITDNVTNSGENKTVTSSYDYTTQELTPKYDITIGNISAYFVNVTEDNIYVTNDPINVTKDDTTAIYENVQTKVYNVTTESINVTKIQLSLTNDDVFKTISLAGSIGAIVCYFCIIGLLFGMGMKGRRAHIHCNVCFSLMSVHVLLLVGDDREAGSIGCKIVSMVTQFFILVGVTWLMLEGIHLFRLSMVGSNLTPEVKSRHKDGRIRHQRIDMTMQNNRPRIPYAQRPHNQRRETIEEFLSDENEDSNSSPAENNSNTPDAASQMRNNQISRQTETTDEDSDADYDEQSKKTNGRCCSRLFHYYVFGWIGPAMFIGATFPAALAGYGKSENCWLVTETSIIWIFSAPVPAIFLFHCVVIILTIVNCKKKIRSATVPDEVMETTNMTKHSDDLLRHNDSHPQDMTSETTSPTSSSRARLHRTRDSSVKTRRTSSIDMILEQEQNKRNSRTSYDANLTNARHYRQLHDEVHCEHGYHDEGYFDDGNYGNVAVHPPIFEIRQRTLAVTLPDDELNEPVTNYLSAAYWHAFLLPLVCATWSCGIVATNFHWVALNYTFCTLNIAQALYIFIFYCIVTFRLRQKWHVMTSQEVNEKARPVTVLLGNDPDDGCDNINERRMGRYRRRKKIPNIDLMTRTPTPFKSSKRRYREDESSDSDSKDSRKIRWDSKHADDRGQKPLNRLQEVEEIDESLTNSIMTHNPNLLTMMQQLNNVQNQSSEKEREKDANEQAKITRGNKHGTFGAEKEEIQAVAEVADEIPPGQNIEGDSIDEYTGYDAMRVLPLCLSAEKIPPTHKTTEAIVQRERESRGKDSLSRSMHKDIYDILNDNSIDRDNPIVSRSVKPKPPFIKSISEKNMIKQHRMLRSTNSFPSSRENEASRSVDLSTILSCEPFDTRKVSESFGTPSDNSRKSTTSINSQASLLPNSVTSPAVVGSPLATPTASPVLDPRKTFNFDTGSEVMKDYKPILPKAREGTQKFSPIAIFNRNKRDKIHYIETKFNK